MRPCHRGCVATIGNFDGVHLGHQMILAQLAEKSAELRLPSQAIFFEPTPSEFFAGGRAPARLACFREKMQALQRYEIDRVLCLRFNQPLANMPANDFIRTILLDGLGVRFLVVGDDFRFGRGRQGDFRLLKTYGREHGFEVINTATHEIDGERVSSTRIRHALQAGELELARRLLGRPYRISGRVSHGERLGHDLGFPTANIRLARHASPVRGVFAVHVLGLGPGPLPAVANVGTRPTVGGSEPRLEVHLFDFTEDIYGRHLDVDFLTKIRDEVRFDSLDALKSQIASDVATARAFLRRQASQPR